MVPSEHKGDPQGEKGDGKKIPRIQVTLPEGVHEVFVRFCEQRGGSMSDAAASMIEQYLTEHSFLTTHIQKGMSENKEGNI